MKPRVLARCAMAVITFLCLGCGKAGRVRRKPTEPKPEATSGPRVTGPAVSVRQGQSASTKAAKERTVDGFVKALRDSGIEIKQESPLPGGRFPGSTKGSYLYLDSLEEWIEVYEFASPADATKAFPNNLYSMTFNQNKIETKVEIKGVLVLFVYEQHSQWPQVYAVWQKF